MTNGDLRNKIDKLWTDFWLSLIHIFARVQYLFGHELLLGNVEGE